MSYPGAEGTLIGALRGPLVLILLGALLAADQLGTLRFSSTWPALLILYGVLKLMDRGPGQKSES
jgi:hypothetical protein